MTPFHFEVYTNSGEKIMTIKRGVTFISSNVKILDANDQLIGVFKQTFFSIGGKFKAFDAQDNFLFTLQGKWTSWDFKLIAEGVEFAQVSKKWSGIGKELFTTSDNYMLTISEQVPLDNPLRLLILAAVACIDLVLKE